METMIGTAVCHTECTWSARYGEWRFDGPAAKLARKIRADYNDRYKAIGEQVFGWDAPPLPDEAITAILTASRVQAAAEGYGYWGREDGSYQLCSPIGTVEIAPPTDTDDYEDAGDMMSRSTHTVSVGPPIIPDYYQCWQAVPPVYEQTGDDLEDFWSELAALSEEQEASGASA